MPNDKTLERMIEENGGDLVTAAARLAREHGMESRWRRRPGHEMVGLLTNYLAELEEDDGKPCPAAPLRSRGAWCLVPLSLAAAPAGSVGDAAGTAEARLYARSHELALIPVMEDWQVEPAERILAEWLEKNPPGSLTTLRAAAECLDRMDRLGTGSHTLAIHPGDGIEATYGRLRTMDIINRTMDLKLDLARARGISHPELSTLEKHLGRRSRNTTP